jgi:hypothetical protein
MMKALIIIPTIALLIINLADGASTTKGVMMPYFEWDEQGCPNLIDDKLFQPGTSSNMKLYAISDGTSGKTSISFHYSHWKCKSDSIATQTYVDSHDQETSTTVVVSKDLKKGSVSSTFQAPISINEYRLNRDGSVKLVPISRKDTTVTIKATLVGTGDIYTDDATESPARAATVSIALTAQNGTPMPVPSDAHISDYMYRKDN